MNFFSDSSVESELPSTSNYNDTLGEISRIRDFTYTSRKALKKKRSYKKRGPAVSTVQAKLYHLPGGSEKPIFSKFHNSIVQRHFQNGYGYATECFDVENQKIKKLSIPIWLSERQFKFHLQEIFRKLQPEMYFYKMDLASNFVAVHIKTPWDIKRLNYQGTLIVSNDKVDIPIMPLFNLQAPVSQDTGQNLRLISNHQSSSMPPASASNRQSRGATSSTRSPKPSATNRPIDFSSSTSFNNSTSQERQQTANQTNSANSTFVETAPSPTITDLLAEEVSSPIELLPDLERNTIITNHRSGPSTMMSFKSPVPSASAIPPGVPIQLSVQQSRIGLSSTRSSIPSTTNRPVVLASSIVFNSSTSKIRQQTANQTNSANHTFVETAPPLTITDLLAEEPSSPIELLPDLEPKTIITAVSSSSSEDEQGVTPKIVDNEIFKIRQQINNRQEVFIRRNYLFEDALEQFKAIEELTILKVKYDEESGEDFEGLTRDFFSEFWNAFIQKYTDGDSFRYLFIKPDGLAKDDPLICGRVLVLGYILTGFLPWRLNEYTLFYILTGNSSSSDQVNSFLCCLPEATKEMITSCRYLDNFSSEMKLSIASLLSKFSFSTLPKPEDFDKTMTSLAQFVLEVQPFFMLNYLRQGAETFSRSLPKFEFRCFKEIITIMKPTGREIAKKLMPLFSEDIELRMAEERVFNFLENFVEDLNVEESSLFMKFVFAQEVVADVNVAFNGESNKEMMIPTASTCGTTINLSRFFMTQDQFSEIMKNVLKNKAMWKTFEVI